MCMLPSSSEGEPHFKVSSHLCGNVTSLVVLHARIHLTLDCRYQRLGEVLGMTTTVSVGWCCLAQNPTGVPRTHQIDSLPQQVCVTWSFLMHLLRLVVRV
jgi:hypothetical protein